MKMKHPLLAAVGCFCLCTSAFAAPPVPNLLNYQGRVAVGTPPVNFNGDGFFKFALVNAAGDATYWSNDGTSNGGSQPAERIPLVVTKGLYSVLLGDTTTYGPNMTAIPANIWRFHDLHLRVWFDDTVNGFQRLDPDQRLAPNGYLPDGVVSFQKLEDSAVSSSKLEDGAVTSEKIAAGLTLNGTTTGTFSGNGAALGDLTAGNIATGTLADARLSGNVALRSGGNTFSGSQAITNGSLRISGSDLFLLGGNNADNGLGWYGAAKPFASLDVSGPVLYGIGGGALGTSDSSFPFFPLRQIALRWTSSGNVGIGTTDPGSTLQVAGGIRARGGAPGGNGILNNGYAFASNSGDTDSGMFSSADGQIEFFNNGIERIRVTNNGYVGIGTNNPQAKLHVDGGVVFNGNVEIGINPTITCSGRLRLQSTSNGGLQLNPSANGGDVYIGGGGAFPNLHVLGQIVSHGITTSEAFGPDTTFVGSPGNYIAFGHASTSEDFIGYHGNTFYFRDSPSGADVLQPNVDVGGDVLCLALHITSDRNAKEQFKPVNAREVLDKVARLPITEWQYKQQSDDRHMGPMAQDFREAFGLGRDEKRITSVDADGVALAAIQGLNEKLEEQTREKDRRIRELEQSVEELKTLVNRLTSHRDGGEP